LLEKWFSEQLKKNSYYKP